MTSLKSFDTFDYKEARNAADKANRNGTGIKMLAHVVETIRVTADQGLYSSVFNRNDLKGAAEFCHRVLFHKGFQVILTDQELRVSWWGKG